MATNVQNILQAAKKQKASSNNGTQAAPMMTESPVIANNVTELESLYSTPSNGMVQGLDYTLYPNGEERKVYDAAEEMREIKEGGGFSAAAKTKMPKAILESVLTNPLDMPIPSDIDTQLMNEELQNRTVDLIGKLESRDRGNRQAPAQMPIMETTEHSTGDASSLLTQISKMIDAKLAKLERRLAENQGPGMKMIKINEGSSFIFMDNDNNVYECTMKYKGKGKIRK